MAANRLRMPILAFSALSICLSVAIIGCAGRTFNIFNTQQKTNPWLLPIWKNHFNTRELQALIGTSAATIILNSFLILALFIAVLPASFIILSTSLLSLACSLVAIIFPTVINGHAPTIDTLQTWTCRWTNEDIGPSSFNEICHETRFAFYTTIPVFIIQLLLVSIAVYAIVAGRTRRAARLGSDTEKGQSQHELGSVRNGSFDAKSAGSPISANDSPKVGIVNTKAVQFA